MIDLDKEEFLKRLDVRIGVISSVLAFHEKYLLRDLPRKEFLKAEKCIDDMNLKFNNFILETDEKIKLIYEEARSHIQIRKET